MTLEHDPRCLMRLLGMAIWFAMSLAFFVEVGGLLGWVLGQPGWGIRAGIVAQGLLWLCVLRGGRDG